MIRAGNGTRTRDPNLGKVVLYQLSYSRDCQRSINAAVYPVVPTPMENFSSEMEARGIEPLTS